MTRVLVADSRRRLRTKSENLLESCRAVFRRPPHILHKRFDTYTISAIMQATRMKAPVIAIVNAYDSTPLNQVYQLYLRFDPSPNRNWTIDETKYAAGVWAEKFSRFGRFLIPGLAWPLTVRSVGRSR